MAAIFQIRRATTNISIADGEIYLHKGSGSIQFGSGSNNPITLLPLNAPVAGDIDLIGNISASGDVRIGGNIYLGNASADNISALGQFTTNLVPSGQIDVGTTSSPWRYVYATNISASNITASINGINITTFSTSVDARLDSLELASASLQTFSSSQLSQNSTLATYTSSVESRLSTLATYTGSVESRFTSLATISGSLISTASANTISIANINPWTASAKIELSNLESKSASVDTSISNINTYTSSLKTALTVSGTNVTVAGNLTVNGTTTAINSTTLQLGDNIIELNGTGVANGGLLVKDPTGASLLSGSLLWDSTLDYWKGGTSGNESKLLLAGGDSVISSSAQLTQLNSFTSSTNTRLSNIETKSASVDVSISNINTETASLEARATTLAQITSSLLSWTASAKVELTNLETKSASVDVSISNINSWTASAKVELSNLESTSASVNTSIANINTTTSSINDRFTTLATYTGSIDSKFTTLLQVTASLIAATASLYNSASNHEARLDELEYTTSVNLGTGAQVALSEINRTTASLNVFTASVAGTNVFTSSTNIRLSNLELTSASINAWSSSLTNTFATDAEVAAGYEAKGRGIVSGSSQITPLLPVGVVSGSSQISGLANNQLTNNSITIAGTLISLGGSITAATILGGTNVISSSAQITSILPAGVVSGSSQIDATATTNWATGIKTQLNTNTVVSGSSQINLGSAAGNITLATQTIGDYVASLVQGTGVTITNNSGENSTPTIAIGQAVGTSANVQFSSIGVGTTASGTAGEIRATGDITAYYSSDIRLKENIIPIANALEKVNQISGNTYDWKEGYDEVHSHKGNDVGVIAQEIEQILPQIVTNRDTGFKAVQYEKIIPLLIEAIKELSAKVDRLENK